MPVWLSLFIAGSLTLGFFGGLYFLITIVVEGMRAKAKPRFGIVGGDMPGTLGIWATWDVKQFAVNVYRLKFSFARPDSKLKEGVFSITLDPPQSGPFFVPVELSSEFRKVVEESAARKALITVEMKTAEDHALAITSFVGKFRNILAGKKGKAPKIANRLPLAVADVPWIASLEYQELLARTKKIKDMEAAAAAKAAKAAASKAAAAAAATVPAPIAAPIVAKEAPVSEPEGESPAAKAAAALAAVRTASRQAKPSE